MSQTISIDIDAEVFKHLQQHAEPLTDTPNQVLRRLLGLKTTSSPTPRPARKRPPGEPTPSRAAVIIALQNNPDATTRELTRAAGVAYSTCTKILRELNGEGAVDRRYDPSAQRGVQYLWRLAIEDDHSGSRPRDK